MAAKDVKKMIKDRAKKIEKKMDEKLKKSPKHLDKKEDIKLINKMMKKKK